MARELTDGQVETLALAERRRLAGAQVRFRLAGTEGAIRFLDDLVAGLSALEDERRHGIEPELVARKARLLARARGLRVLVPFLAFARDQLLDSVLPGDE